MPYKILGEEVQILKRVGGMTDIAGNHYDEHVSVTWYLGDVVPDDDVAPTVQLAYEEGDEHVRSLIEYTDEAPASSEAAQEPPEAPSVVEGMFPSPEPLEVPQEPAQEPAE